MKRMLLGVVMCCALFSFGAAWGQEVTVSDENAAGEEMVATETEVSPAAELTIQQQLDELRAKITELEAQLADSKTATDQELYAINDAQSKRATGEKIKVSGYIQSQFTDDQAANPATDFRVRRARIKLEAPVTDLVKGLIEFDATRTVELKEAFIDVGRSQDPWLLRLGQTKVPFMYDILQSSSVRLAPEQTAVAQYLFPGEYDQGLYLKLKNALGDSIPGATLDLGVQNGQGMNAAETNENKDLVARLRFVLGNTPPDTSTEANTFYLAYIKGELTDAKTAVTTDKNGLGAGISYLLGPTWLRGEYLTGENLGHDFMGWYGQLAYEIPHTPGTLFARYDVFDENTDASNDQYKDLTVGYQHQIDAKTRAILAYELRDPESGYSKFAKTDGNLLTLRLQVKY